MNARLSIVTTCHPDSRVMDAFYRAIDSFASERTLPIELIAVSNLLPPDIRDSSFRFGDYVELTKLNYDHEGGQTGSIIKGLIESGGNPVLSIDPDMVSSLYAIDDMLRLWDRGYKVVMARRELRYRVWWRAVSTYFFNVFISLVLGFRVNDLNSPMFMVEKSIINHLASLSLPLEAYKLRLIMDYRSDLVEIPVRDASSRSGVSSTYGIGILLSLFIKRLWLALKLRVIGN